MRLLALFTSIAIAAMLGACSGGDEELQQQAAARYDMVTYTGWEQGVQHFTCHRRGDSASVELLATAAQPTHIVAGQRLLLYYNVLDASNSRQWTVQARSYNYSGVITDTVQATLRPDTLQQHPVKLLSAWRTGPYLNLRLQAEYTSQPRRLRLVAHQGTLDADTVHLTLEHDLLAGAGSEAFWRQAYGSFFAKDITDRPTCSAIAVHIKQQDESQENIYLFEN